MLDMSRAVPRTAPAPAKRTQRLVASGLLRVELPDGSVTTLHPIWLRENLPDPRIRDTRTGQRVIEAGDLDLALTIVSATDDGMVTFSDGFSAFVPEEWLIDTLRPRAPERRLWSGLTTFPTAPSLPPAVSYRDMRRKAHTGANAPLRDFLETLAKYGFAVVSDVPVEQDGALDFAGEIGPIRTTNWGGLADVKAIANAYDLTMTPRHLEPHSDNPYREPVPGYILLHCLENDATGGDSTLVDGFAAAERLRREDPESFDILSSTDVLFRYRDDTTLLERRAPLIACDSSGAVVQVHYSNRTENIDCLPPGRLTGYYRARRAFWQLIKPESEMTITFKLAPGELLMMDNYRLFHGRTGYRLQTGTRHMRQCYMDRDTVANRLDQLRRAS